MQKASLKQALLGPFGITSGILFLFFLTNFFVPKVISFVVPSVLLFVPIFVLPPGQGILATLCLDTSFKRFFKSVAAFVLVTVLVFPPYLVGAHFWMLKVFGYHGFHAAPWGVFFNLLPYQFLMVAFPEEFFFRGYLQPALNKAFQSKWRGVIVTSLIFAFAHSVIHYQWWHFSIFFPALLFGLLKEKTGSIIAPILFHTFCNSFMVWFTASYF